MEYHKKEIMLKSTIIKKDWDTMLFILSIMYFPFLNLFSLLYFFIENIIAWILNINPYFMSVVVCSMSFLFLFPFFIFYFSMIWLTPVPPLNHNWPVSEIRVRTVHPDSNTSFQCTSMQPVGSGHRTLLIHLTGEITRLFSFDLHGRFPSINVVLSHKRTISGTRVTPWLAELTKISNRFQRKLYIQFQ